MGFLGLPFLMDSHKPILPSSDSSGQCFLNQGEQKHVEKTDQSEEQHPDGRLLKVSERDNAFQPSPVQHKQMISIFHNREEVNEGSR